MLLAYAKNRSEKPTHHTYKLLGESTTSFQVKREDRAQAQVFTKATFDALLDSGRLEIIDEVTFKVEIDKDFNPQAQFKPVEL